MRKNFCVLFSLVLATPPPLTLCAFIFLVNDIINLSQMCITFNPASSSAQVTAIVHQTNRNSISPHPPPRRVPILLAGCTHTPIWMWVECAWAILSGSRRISTKLNLINKKNINFIFIETWKFAVSFHFCFLSNTQHQSHPLLLA